MTAPLLVIGVGNPSRGDDALGPLFVERLRTAMAGAIARGEVEVLTEFQLQVEHALDIAGRAGVFFVDASVSAAPPFEIARVVPERDASFSTHALSPAAVLDTCRRVLGEPPASWVVAIRGEQFELGDDLSAAAATHLDAALAEVMAVLEAEGRSHSLPA